MARKNTLSAAAAALSVAATGASAGIAATAAALSAPAASSPVKRAQRRAEDGTRIPDNQVVSSIAQVLAGEKVDTAYIKEMVAGKVKFSQMAWEDRGATVTVFREHAGSPKSGQKDAVVRCYKAESGLFVAEVHGGDVEKVIGAHEFETDDPQGMVQYLVGQGLWSGAKASSFFVGKAPAAAEAL